MMSDAVSISVVPLDEHQVVKSQVHGQRQEMLTCFVGERDGNQKETFTKWVNGHLSQVGVEVRDLFKDLRDGRNLLLLLEVLSGERLLFATAREAGNLHVHAVRNVQLAIDYLTRNRVKLVNIHAADVVSGHPKLTLGLVWAIILHFHKEKESTMAINPGDAGRSKEDVLERCANHTRKVICTLEESLSNLEKLKREVEAQMVGQERLNLPILGTLDDQARMLYIAKQRCVAHMQYFELHNQDLSATPEEPRREVTFVDVNEELRRDCDGASKPSRQLNPTPRCSTPKKHLNKWKVADGSPLLFDNIDRCSTGSDDSDLAADLKHRFMFAGAGEGGKGGCDGRGCSSCHPPTPARWSFKANNSGGDNAHHVNRYKNDGMNEIQLKTMPAERVLKSTQSEPKLRKKVLAFLRRFPKSNSSMQFSC